MRKDAIEEDVLKCDCEARTGRNPIGLLNALVWLSASSTS